MKPFNSPPESKVPEIFGAVGTRQKYVLLPYPMKLSWAKDTLIHRFQCHELVHESMAQIFEDILEEYGIGGVRKLGLDLFGGCLNVRTKRGSPLVQSMHSWGIAVDMHPEENRYKWGAELALFSNPEYDAYWKIVEKHGAVSLGRVRGWDYMHWQFATIEQ